MNCIRMLRQERKVCCVWQEGQNNSCRKQQLTSWCSDGTDHLSVAISESRARLNTISGKQAHNRMDARRQVLSHATCAQRQGAICTSALKSGQITGVNQWHIIMK